ncbi:hypothetical protein, partial [Lysinibacillus xylanilyticus]|uniref:hypothetical protein n=1 Tax=Lysinibacillus xylanilyticus TaxID=582475 RepID=UPI0036DE3819
SKIDMNLVYDGPGVYTWELYAGGKLVAQAPYSTPLGVDGTPLSQNGLPVLTTLANKDAYMSNLDGVDPNAANGANIGEEIGGVPADDVSAQNLEEPLNPDQQQNKKKLYMIWGLVVFLLVVFAGLFIVYKRKQRMDDEEEESGFVQYKRPDEEESASGDSSKFEEVE